MGRLIFFLSFVILLNACQTQNNRTDADTKTVKKMPENNVTTVVKVRLVKDSVYDNLQSKSNGVYSYSVFIPSSANKLPLLFLFDPHADGTIPVKKYKDLARKYGVALIASNNSQNGLNGNDYYGILSTAFRDITGMFSEYIDTSIIFTGGFSGGGRVASMFAAAYKIPVVISAGAGVANPDNISFNFIGFAGKYDFNFIELASLDEVFSRKAPDKEHYMEFFDGIHEWPDPEIYETAFEYLKFYLFKTGKEKKDESFCEEFERKIKSEISRTKNPLEKEKLLEKITVFGKGVFDVTDYEKELEELRGTSSYKDALKKRNEIFNEELNLRQAYAGALLNKPVAWWKNKMQEFDKLEKDNSEEAAMYKRIRNFLSLNTYMLINKYIKQGNVLYAEQMLELYKVIDPENKEIPNLEKEIKGMN